MRLIDADALMEALGITDMECEKCVLGNNHGECVLGTEFRDACAAIKDAPAIEPERKKGKWTKRGKQMVINLENAREQYSVLGYPHRNILKLQCSECRMITFVDQSILYDFCPHCGADMREE